MPTISVFFGITIQMYWRDHPPPHMHVFYSGEEALIAIATGEIVAGKLPKAALRIVQDWAQLRRSELMENWRRAEQKLELLPVPGADTDD
jgi:hypothetical protein